MEAGSAKRDQAFELFKKHNGNITNQQIADIVGVKRATVCGWRYKFQWNEKLNITTKQYKANEPLINIDPDDIPIGTNNLNEKQRLFCLYYVKSFNATQAAIRAGYSRNSAYTIGHDLLGKPRIISCIREIKSKMRKEVFVDSTDVLDKHCKIAFADMTDFVEFGQKADPVPPDQSPGTNTPPQVSNYVHLKSSDEVDGSLIQSIKVGKDGAVTVKLQDKSKSLDTLTRYMDLTPDRHKRHIEEEKLALSKEQFALTKLKVMKELQLANEPARDASNMTDEERRARIDALIARRRAGAAATS